MRTQTDILMRFRALEEASDDFFGFRREVLTEGMSYETIKGLQIEGDGFLSENVTQEKWNEVYLDTDDKILKALSHYLDFAWGKAEDHRGLSASRSVDKLAEYAWLLGRDDVVEAMGDASYTNYGCPKLAVLAKALDLPIPESDRIQNMIVGKSCGADYDCGCGS